MFLLNPQKTRLLGPYVTRLHKDVCIIFKPSITFISILWWVLYLELVYLRLGTPSHRLKARSV